MAIKKSRNGEKRFAFVEKSSISEENKLLKTGSIQFALNDHNEMPLTQLTPLYC